MYCPYVPYVHSTDNTTRYNSYIWCEALETGSSKVLTASAMGERTWCFALEGQQSSGQEPPEEPFFVVHEIGTESPCSYSNPAFVREHFACCPCCLYFSWRNQLILLSFSRLRTLTLRSTKQSACRSTRLLLSPSSPAPGGFTVSPTKCLRISSKVVSGDIRW